MSVSPTPLLELRAVSYEYATPVETVSAVRDASLTVWPGQLVSVRGASGSGKSTLLNLVAGLVSPTQGAIEVGGRRVDVMNERQRTELRLTSVGMVFQEHALVAEFTSLENIALPLEARGFTVREAMAEAESLLARLDMEGLGHRLPSELSGGQRQRVGVGRALAGGRQLILADEPTGALDSATSQSLFSLLRRLCDEGTAVVLCSHDPDVAAWADRTLHMKDGHLTEVTPA